MSAIFDHICGEITKRAETDFRKVAFTPTAHFRGASFTLRVVRKMGISHMAFEDAATEFTLDIGEELLLHDEDLGFVSVQEESITKDSFVLTITDRDPDRK